MKNEFTNGIRNEEGKQHENEEPLYKEQKQRRNALSKKKILTLALCCALVGAAGEPVAVSAMEEIGEIRNTGLSDEDVYIGITVTDITVTEAAASGLSEGAVVQAVIEDSPAEEAGLEAGDIITEADGKEITGSSDLVSVIRSSSVGDEVVLTVYRDGETLELTVTVGADSSSESSASENIGNPYSANNNNRAYRGYHSEDGVDDDESFSNEEEGNYSNGFLNSQGVSRSEDDSL